AHYTLIAKNFSDHSLLAPTPDGRDVFLETPPLYPWLLHAVFLVTGPSVVAGRLLSIAASVALVAATASLGAALFGSFAGILAGLLVAVMPVCVLAGRNIQTDSLLVLLLTLSAHLCWRANREDTRGGESGRTWALFSLIFGVALMTKLFALVGGAALALWLTVERRGFSWLKKGTPWVAAGGALLLPVLYYGYQAAVRPAELAQDFSAGAGLAHSASASASEVGGTLIEAMWAFSPAVALLILFGFGASLSAWKSDSGVRLAFVLAAAFSTLFFFVHKHSYYLLTVVPWASLLAGRALSRVRPAPLRVGLAAAAALSAVFVSSVDVTAMKLGFDEFDGFRRVARNLPGRTHPLLVSQEMWDSYSTVLWLADPKARLSVPETLPVAPDGSLVLAPGTLFLEFVPPQTEAPPAGWLFSRERFGLTLFGWTFVEAHANPHFFRQGRYFVQRSGPAWMFGATSLRAYPALAAVPIPPEARIHRGEAGLVMR
ncbi:MAG TPA: glycosyltransferase family 39 protein, partial [Thermoanaerobaculia bacterium]|nr:glycosyltransferase family 39 protein [Thermoanaerobaculia bacterium]